MNNQQPPPANPGGVQPSGNQPATMDPVAAAAYYAWYAQYYAQQQQQQQQQAQAAAAAAYYSNPAYAAYYAQAQAAKQPTTTVSQPMPSTSTYYSAPPQPQQATKTTDTSVAGGMPPWRSSSSPKPAYTVVKPRSTTTNTSFGTIKTETGKPPIGLPTKKNVLEADGSISSKPCDAVSQYVDRVLRCTPKEMRDTKATPFLRDLLNEAKSLNKMGDEKWWAHLPLPKFCKSELDVAPPAAVKTPPKATKRPRKDSDSDDDLKILSPSHSTTSLSSATELMTLDEEQMRREQRLKRFKGAHMQELQRRKERDRLRKQAAVVQAASILAGAEGNPDVYEWDEHTVVGTCSKLEKPYLRLTSAPDPSTVRPLHVLRQTFEFLKTKWKQERNYTYICDQFKSLRQDLTVQRIKNEFTTRVYEAHARIALEKGDLGEYNQCQSQLKQLYALGLNGNKDEFTAYRILYYIHTANRSDLSALIATLSEAEKRHPYTAYALQVRTVIAHSDYHALFKLYNQPTGIMSGYLMDQFIDRERIRALKIMCKAYRPTLDLAFLANEFGFIVPEQEDEPPSKEAIEDGYRECRDWLDKLGVVWSMPPAPPASANTKQTSLAGGVMILGASKGKGKSIKNPKTIVDMKESFPIVNSKLLEATGKIDIKGQIH